MLAVLATRETAMGIEYIKCNYRVFERRPITYKTKKYNAVVNLETGLYNVRKSTRNEMYALMQK